MGRLAPDRLYGILLPYSQCVTAVLFAVAAATARDAVDDVVVGEGVVVSGAYFASATCLTTRPSA